ncbi:hypothetical protein EHS25_001933 [Saitozyma podzolica]|uniref:Alkyl hydroperoxide reductase subunit C/ Thiol specific antioxidant domain-containing protein n=1 Tax=Saitozyma podzolica TaxID=1890683 RepID=A0A427YG28_9TREE|nr:hypothetical protein EHS25_001933 [Saitozyma podzolica]
MSISRRIEQSAVYTPASSRPSRTSRLRPGLNSSPSLVNESGVDTTSLHQRLFTMTEVNDTLAPQLASVWSNLKANAPSSVVDKIQSSRSDLIGTWDASQVIKVGARLPSFTLPNATGDPISSESLLVKGPLLICYYRGE